MTLEETKIFFYETITLCEMYLAFFSSVIIFIIYFTPARVLSLNWDLLLCISVINKSRQVDPLSEFTIEKVPSVVLKYYVIVYGTKKKSEVVHCIRTLDKTKYRLEESLKP